jgi:glucosamine-6-phosphate deaminase
MRVFSVDELCPPAPPDGYFWRQVRTEFLRWADVPLGHGRPFTVDAADLATMCDDDERSLAAAGGLDLMMLGLGPNGHIASNEPPAAFDSHTRPVRLLASTVDYILADDVIQGAVCDVAVTAVTLGVATIVAAREIVVLVSGRGKRTALGRRAPACTILADLKRDRH